MATQAPTFGLDGSELDVMDGLFFNELTDLPVEPAHNQTLFAQPKSEPPITDEELIASLPLNKRRRRRRAARCCRLHPSASKEARKDVAHPRERGGSTNREHARRSRCRKKPIIESLQQSLTAYQAEYRTLEAICKGQIRRSGKPRLDSSGARPGRSGEATDTDLTGGAAPFG